MSVESSIKFQKISDNKIKGISYANKFHESFLIAF